MGEQSRDLFERLHRDVKARSIDKESCEALRSYKLLNPRGVPLASDMPRGPRVVQDFASRTLIYWGDWRPLYVCQKDLIQLYEKQNFIYDDSFPPPFPEVLYAFPGLRQHERLEFVIDWKPERFASGLRIDHNSLAFVFHHRGRCLRYLSIAIRFEGVTGGREQRTRLLRGTRDLTLRVFSDIAAAEPLFGRPELHIRDFDDPSLSIQG